MVSTVASMPPTPQSSVAAPSRTSRTGVFGGASPTGQGFGEGQPRRVRLDIALLRLRHHQGVSHHLDPQVGSRGLDVPPFGNTQVGVVVMACLSSHVVESGLSLVT